MLSSVAAALVALLACQRSGAQPLALGQHTALMTVYNQTKCSASVCPRFAANATCVGTLLACADGNVTVLDLRAKQLTGFVPSAIGSFPALGYLDLSANGGLSGAFPTWIGMLTALTVLYCGGVGFAGSIPTEIGRLTQLTGLVIENTASINGTIPTEIENLSKIVALLIRSTSVSGTLPSGLSRLTNLQQLRVNTNRLAGSVPALPFVTQCSLDLNCFNCTTVTAPVCDCDVRSNCPNASLLTTAPSTASATISSFLSGPVSTITRPTLTTLTITPKSVATTATGGATTRTSGTLAARTSDSSTTQTTQTSPTLTSGGSSVTVSSALSFDSPSLALTTTTATGLATVPGSVDIPVVAGAVGGSLIGSLLFVALAVFFCRRRSATKSRPIFADTEEKTAEPMSIMSKSQYGVVPQDTASSATTSEYTRPPAAHSTGEYGVTKSSTCDAVPPKSDYSQPVLAHAYGTSNSNIKSENGHGHEYEDTANVRPPQSNYDAPRSSSPLVF